MILTTLYIELELYSEMISNKHQDIKIQSTNCRKAHLL